MEQLDKLEKTITGHKIPIGQWSKAIIEWMTDNFEWLFDAISSVMKSGIDGTANGLLLVPPLVLLVMVAAVAHLLQRNWKITLFVFLGLLFILNLGLWKEMVQTLVLVLYATLASLMIGIPIGILAARRKTVWHAIAPVLDMMQTLPTFVYLVPMLALFGLGVVPGLFATVIFAVPAPIRLTYLGISQVPVALVEAGESFGSTRSQLLFRVKLPAALPTIMAGITQCIMLSLSMVVIAALVGAGGLGAPTVRALATGNIPLGTEAGLAIVILAIALDRLMKQRQVKK
ncbi:choline ABC transporter permease subunit [Dongia deserti]|uniref:choline ABC transporter permease subunit n=1 Tax=Dongia deserti TaxID=2268030 RepID=UPI000E6559EA|nr:choline ABC transporter permease subunit [Dongia deserti]